MLFQSDPWLLLFNCHDKSTKSVFPPDWWNANEFTFVLHHHPVLIMREREAMWNIAWDLEIGVKLYEFANDFSLFSYEDKVTFNFF